MAYQPEIKSWELIEETNQSKIVEEQIWDIFFLCSFRKNFASEEEKKEFYDKWTKYYFSYSSSLFYVAFEKEKVLGYLMACENSHLARDYYQTTNPSYLAFEDKFDHYPCHFHINCHPSSQGKGVGKALVQALFDRLKEKQVKGVHIVTSRNAENVKFYQRAGMTDTESRMWKDYEVFFMGKKL